MSTVKLHNYLNVHLQDTLGKKDSPYFITKIA